MVGEHGVQRSKFIHTRSLGTSSGAMNHDSWLECECVHEVGRTNTQDAWPPTHHSISPMDEDPHPSCD